MVSVQTVETSYDGDFLEMLNECPFASSLFEKLMNGKLTYENYVTLINNHLEARLYGKERYPGLVGCLVYGGYYV